MNLLFYFSWLRVPNFNTNQTNTWLMVTPMILKHVVAAINDSIYWKHQNFVEKVVFAPNALLNMFFHEFLVQFGHQQIIRKLALTSLKSTTRSSLIHHSWVLIEAQSVSLGFISRLWIDHGLDWKPL